jgi:hypothetical protein
LSNTSSFLKEKEEEEIKLYDAKKCIYIPLRNNIPTPLSEALLEILTILSITFRYSG